MSTGPRTAEGKASSAMNALKTGVFARHLLLPDDNGDEFGRLRVALYEEWQPVGPTEKNCVERLVALFWRQGRIYKAESGLYAIFRPCQKGMGGVATAIAKDGTETEAFTRLLRMDTTIERSIASTIRMLQRLQEERGQRKGLAREMAPSSASPDSGASAVSPEQTGQPPSS